MSATSISLRRLVGAYAVLLMLLGATVAVSLAKLGTFALVAALLIALLKTIVIAAVFMHLNSALATARTFAITGLLMTALLVAMTVGDAILRIPGDR